MIVPLDLCAEREGDVQSIRRHSDACGWIFLYVSHQGRRSDVQPHFYAHGDQRVGLGTVCGCNGEKVMLKFSAQSLLLGPRCPFTSSAMGSGLLLLGVRVTVWIPKLCTFFLQVSLNLFQTQIRRHSGLKEAIIYCNRL